MILITGATGNVGSEVVEQLRHTGQPVRVMSRNPEKADFPENVEVVRGDLNDAESVKSVLDGVQKVFLIQTPDSDDFPGLAKQSGVEHIVFLSAAAIEVQIDNVIGQTHLKKEEFIKESGVAWTFLRPGAFMSNALQWTNSIQSEGVVRAPFGDIGMAPIDPHDIAAAAVTALTETGHNGQIYSMNGPEVLTPREQVQILSTATGKDIRFENISRDAAKERMARFIPEPIVEASLDLIQFSAEHPAQVSNTVKEVTGRNARTFKQWAEEHAELFM